MNEHLKGFLWFVVVVACIMYFVDKANAQPHNIGQPNMIEMFEKNSCNRKSFSISNQIVKDATNIVNELDKSITATPELKLLARQNYILSTIMIEQLSGICAIVYALDRGI